MMMGIVLFKGRHDEYMQSHVKTPILKKYGDKVDTIILFGSTARGEAGEDSDIDILVVVG